MKNKLTLIITISVISLGTIALIYQSKQMEFQKLLEDKRQELIILLADNLDQFDPTLATFVDDNYKTLITSEISSEGIVELNRGLAKNEEPFGNYIVKYDLENMEVLFVELEVTNQKYSEEWREFIKANNQ
ncbi:hypothetical protein H1D32_12590 [Anaerobacillus sp. CMMVII]|uniref:hypothetical protein n=1 Tax=Anaerobacillus sp. CMMVII TaxID=2755588 RepID=UPI0021B793CC|nr:hypothetical protein [Anaerobacillus sp. CMMVII]MCT8138504.1 hypothetical protein [Anaerobacillus sp. CMMVII]